MEELSSAKKRKAGYSTDEFQLKRSRAGAGADGGTTGSPTEMLDLQEGSPANQHRSLVKDDTILSSVEEMLSVPVSFILRHVPSSTNASGTNSTSPATALLITSTATQPPSQKQQATPNHHRRQKPLLSRSEAQCFCKINLLAHELDSLTAISTTALHRHLQCASFAQTLQTVDHPFLRPLLPILHTIQQQDTTRQESGMSTTLQQVGIELNRVIAEMQQNAVTLRQCSEQNWTLAETLQDTWSAVDDYSTSTGGGSGQQLLAVEKQKLSDVQEEICQRIDSLVMSTSGTSCNCDNARSSSELAATDESSNMSASTTTRRNATGPMVSMHEYCARIFSVLQGEEEESKSAVVALQQENIRLPPPPADEILSDPEEAVLAEPSPPARKAAPPSETSAATTLSAPVSSEQKGGTSPSPSEEKENSQSPLPHRSSSSTATSSTPRIQPPQLQSKDSSKTPSERGSEEKENAQQSQSSSQNSSHRSSTTHGIEALLAEAAAQETTGSSLGFESQHAVEVLSTMAAAAASRGGAPESDKP